MQQSLTLIIGTVALVIIGLFVAVGFVAVPVTNAQRVEYTCVCGERTAVDPFHSYSDCNTCGHRAWWPVMYGVPCNY